MTDANRCSICGAERTDDAPEGLCSNCFLNRAMLEPTLPPEGGGTTEPTGDWTPMSGETVDLSGDPPAGSGAEPGANVRYFGDYELRGELGRGGMGVVYKAVQISLHRPVALKMIKAGVLAGEAELRRFQNEAEAVALLDHPGIVPVYEVGEHEGQRYFSMKLVEGANLADRLGSYKADPRGAARLVAGAAEAVHHAHMRGILHRDLKPANILIDEEGHPHVTDFGLAKRVEGDVEMTQSGAILGTPAYMSPEQANGRRGSITTATDVYGLGAILYAALTGRAPFGGDSVIETLDAVRTRPPDPPKKFNAAVPRDLETICLKCLEKDPRRRYPSAQALADDLIAWLDLRPISARRVGSAERAWLWCRRKPAVASLAASALLATVIGTSAVIAVQARANHDLRVSNTKLDVQRVRAEESEGRAIDAVKRFRDVIAAEPELKDTPALARLRGRLLKEPLGFFRALRDRLQAGRETTREALARMADASFELGKLSNEIGDREDALAAYRESLEIRLKLAEAGRPVSRLNVALTHHNIGVLLNDTGRKAEALASFEEAARIFRELADANPAEAGSIRGLLANTRNDVGIILRVTGKPAEALKAHEEALANRKALAGADPAAGPRAEIAQSYVNIALVLGDLGNTAEALKAHEEALKLQRKLAEAEPTVADYRRDLARSLYNTAGLLRGLGKRAEALKAHEEALKIREALAGADPSVIDFQADLASSQNAVGVLRKERGDLLGALKAYGEALAIQRKLAEANPTVTNLRRDLANSHYNIGLLQWAAHDPGEALKSYEEALKIRKPLAEANPTVADYQSDLAAVYNNMGNPLWSSGRQAEAGAAFESASKVLEKLARSHPESPDYASAFGASLSNLAAIDLDAKRFREARARLRVAADWQRKALASLPGHPAYRRYLGDSLERLIEASRGLNDPEGEGLAARELAKLRESDPATLALDDRLEAILRGNQRPKDQAERLRLAQRAYDKGLQATAARLWGEAIAADTALAENRKAGHRYNAACAAALAGSGRGKDVPPPDDAAKAKLRGQALGWLRAELAAWEPISRIEAAGARQAVDRTLAHWKEDSDLAGVRDEKELAALSGDERDAWRALWGEVDALRKRVRGEKS